MTLYEHPAWQTIPDQTMRPGGLTVTARALAFCDLPPGSRVLDLGCGAGATLHHLTTSRGWTAFGVDASVALLTRAQWTSPRLSQAKSEHLPLAPATLDAVLSECTLSLFDTDRALAEIARILKPGGYFIVSDLYARNPHGIDALRHLPPGSCIGAAMTQAEITAKLEQHGLHISVWQDCSEELKTFSMCTLTTAAAIDPFDLVIASARAKLGYYFAVARSLPLQTIEV